METVHTVEWMKQVAHRARAEGQVVGLVPTMGALHEGHISLVLAAQQQCGLVVVSIFVNPKQFGPGEDFEKYPRAMEADRAALEALGVPFLFSPVAKEMYPDGFRTYVSVEGLSEGLEGRSRPGHFRGVTTVVLKLLEVVQPHFAYFGRKDAQQARIIGQMAHDLSLDAEIIVCPIVRGPDGLALSSRNAYLEGDERRAATVLYRALSAARQEIDAGERDAARLLAAIRKVIEAEPLASADYAEIVDRESFEPVSRVRRACLALLAVFVGSVRLIDNMLIEEREGVFTVSL
ncbi:MAG TPA: pantoate--beta-alanine ligase [Candidatus Acidoferrales bacterium]|nr:pantoate--beta-alanine ligase [Candidatus Acidoferrales bacterium]